MPRMRKVVLTVEVKTCLQARELQDLQALIFGALRADSAEEGKRRTTIKAKPPARHRDDVLGSIESVKVKILNDKAKAKAKDLE